MGKEAVTVAVTGASGYLGGHVVRECLARGYTVRATVRDPNNERKVAFLRKLPGAAERLTLYQANLLDEGSFDKVVDGAKIVIHTASPFTTTAADPQRDLIDPAVKGTINVLTAVNKAPSVTRVVLTSSVAALYHSPNDRGYGHVFTEEDWNEKSAPHDNPYYFSKVSAERAAWRMAKEQTRWSLVTLCPGLILGPLLSPRADATSIRLIRKLLGGGMVLGAPRFEYGFVDVRNAAEAHVLAAETPGAQGRYVVADGSVDFLQLADCIRRRGGLLLPRVYLPSWLVYTFGPITDGLTFKYINDQLGFPLRFDNAKIKRDLKIEFIQKEKTMNDMLDSMVAHGLVSRR